MTVTVKSLKNTGTREMAERLRSEIMGILEKAEIVQIDFANSTRITPSFADELVGKLVAEIGLEQFQLRVRLLNVAPATAPLLAAAIAHRSKPSSVA